MKLVMAYEGKDGVTVVRHHAVRSHRRQMSVFNFSTEFGADQKYTVGLNGKTGNQRFPKAQVAEAALQQAPIKQRIAMHCRKAILHTGRVSNSFLFILVLFPMRSTQQMNDKGFFNS